MHFAAEGGFQLFELGSAEWFWLFFSAATAVLAILVGFALMRGVLAADQGTASMIEIAKAIQEGAMAYLKRQFRTIAVILIPVAVVVFVTSTAVEAPKVTYGLSMSGGLSFGASGVFRTLAFVAGCLMSGLTGFIGMSLAVRGNVRTAAAARSGSLPAALKVAFRTGGVAGMFTVGLGLLGATIIIMIFQNTASAILIGFGFGGSLLALFLVITATFFMIRFVPGGPFTAEKAVTPEILRNLEAHYGLDKPLWRQYADYLGSLAKGDLGPSFKEGTYNVNELILLSLPVSLELGFYALIVALIVGVVIVYQTLATQVTRQLPQYATLKAMGYSDRYLLGVLIQASLLLAILGYIPGFFFSIGLYQLGYSATQLLIMMKVSRAVMVLILTITMCAVSASIAMNKFLLSTKPRVV